MSSISMTTSIAPVNIATIKYWGKRDEKLILPTNDSVSVTLSTDQMHARTSVSAAATFDRDRLWLNGEEQQIQDNARLKNCLAQVRAAALEQHGDSLEVLKQNVHVCSENNFPTAAGLASSAAGYACLVHALCQLFRVSGDISFLARQGSGSACRSVHGGFVRWVSGTDDVTGRDSHAVQVAPQSHWPEMRVIICVASDCRKKVASSAGMRNSLKTSELLKHRIDNVVPKRTEEMVKAIRERDFATFASLTMRDSNQLHAVCLDTEPPCFYMSDASRAVVETVNEINRVAGKTIVCYTFDAGPNACLFLLESDWAVVAEVIRTVFFSDASNAEDVVRGDTTQMRKVDKQRVQSLLSSIVAPTALSSPLKYLILTSVGDGPKTMETDEDCLLDRETGMPKATTA